MQIIEETIGGAQVYIETMETGTEVIGEPQKGRRTGTTSIQGQIENVYARAKSVIRSIAADVGQDLTAIAGTARPASVEVEFNMGFSAQVDSWVLMGKGDVVLKVRIKWEPERHES